MTAPLLQVAPLAFIGMTLLFGLALLGCAISEALHAETREL